MAVKKIKEELNALYVSYLAKEQKLLDKLSKKDRALAGSPIKNIKHLDKFDANGVTYYVLTSLCIERFEQFEQMQIKAGFGVDFGDLFANIRKAYDALNANKVADSSVMLYNIMAGIKDNLGARENPILQLCALFICREGEDVTKYDETVATAKINDWKAEGIAMDDFFSIAFSLVNGFTPAYKTVSADIFQNLKKVGEKLVK